jgi:predicted O-linked N-acetylglucosamine transferase (SPINDLY family)
MNAKLMEAIAAFQAGRPDQAEKLFRDIARKRPNDVDAQRMIGFLCNQSGRHADAVVHFDVVLRLNRKQPQINYLRGTSLLALNRHAEALVDFDRALVIDGPHPDTYLNRGAALQKLQRHAEAIESYDRAIALDRVYVLAHTNRAAALEEMGRLAEALAGYDQSLRIQPTAEAWCGRATVLRLMRRFEEALLALKQAHRLEPSRRYLQGEILNLKLNLADWDNFATDCELLFKNIEKGLPAAPPWFILSMPSNPVQQQRAAEMYTRDNVPMPTGGAMPLPARARPAANPPKPVVAGLAPATSSDSAPSQNDRGGRDKPGDDNARTGLAGNGAGVSAKITVGYFSCDFYNHATSQLAAGLFEDHDRSGFTVIGFSYGGRHDDAYARRVAAGMDRFVDISAMSDQEAAALARSLGVDIAVDLAGLVFNARPGIFAHRAAPVQATYLGYPATTGCSFFDYVIADEVVLPPEDTPFFTERPWLIPVSSYVQDSRRPPVEEPRSRAAYGLPEHGFVFCCFNAGYKVTPDAFAVWMRLLQRVDGSVLWLLSNNATFEDNLRKRAKAAGVDPHRLVFAERVELREYLARQRRADLALDTFYYNGHTTTSDALWAGVPVVTKTGNTFASRVAASMLQAIGLPDLITHTAEEYEELAYRLATEPARIGEVRERLIRNRKTSTLFDTAVFTRNIEAAYRRMMDIRTHSVG